MNAPTPGVDNRSDRPSGKQPGWRQDPSGANQWRFFDGSNWTDFTRVPGQLPSFGLWLSTSLNALVARPLTSLILGLVAGGIPAVLLGVLIVLRFAETQADAAPIVEASGRGLFELLALFSVMVLIWAMGTLGLVRFLHGAQRGRWSDANACLKAGRTRTFAFFGRSLIAGVFVLFTAGIVATATTQLGRGAARLIGGDAGVAPLVDWLLLAVFAFIPAAVFIVAGACLFGCVPVAAMIAPDGLSPIRASWQITKVSWKSLAPRMGVVLLITFIGLAVGWYALNKISFPTPIPASLLNGAWPVWVLVGVTSTTLAAILATSLLVRLYLDAGGAERAL